MNKKGRQTARYIEKWPKALLHTKLNMTKCVGFLMETKTTTKRGANINKETGWVDTNKETGITDKYRSMLTVGLALLISSSPWSKPAD